MKPYQLVYISGPGHSGSTLIDLLLNNSPEVQSLGEFHRLNLYARENIEPCTCGAKVAECPFWLSIEDQFIRDNSLHSDASPLKDYDVMVSPSDISYFNSIIQKISLVLGWSWLYTKIGDFVASKHFQAMQYSEQWYDAIHAYTGCKSLVESTKDARRLKLLYFQMRESFRVIYMVRDGRAVAASTMRREGKNMYEAVDEWIDYHRRIKFSMRGIPAEQVCYVKYEELCADPEHVLRHVFRFIGIHFTPSMLMLKKQEAHNIGGNPMRFRADEFRIRLDEKWRSQLDSADLNIFEQKGGKLNRSWGYMD